MSQTAIETFYAQLSDNPDLFQQLLEGVQSADEFIERAITAARSQGLNFSHQEAWNWLQEVLPQTRQELSDHQLESVAGGKGNNSSHTQATQTGSVISQVSSLIFDTIANQVRGKPLSNLGGSGLNNL